MRLAITIPSLGLKFPPPTSVADPLAVRFETLLSDERSLGQVAGVRPLGGKLELIFTAPLEPAAESIRRLDVEAGATSAVTEPVDLARWYGSGAPAAFFFAASHEKGWAYVGSAPGGLSPGLWKRDPASPAASRWTRTTFLTGGANQALLAPQATTSTGKNPETFVFDGYFDGVYRDGPPVQLAIGYWPISAFEGAPKDQAHPLGVARMALGNAVGPNVSFALDTKDRELFNGLHWSFVELDPSTAPLGSRATVSTTVKVNVHITCFAARGTGAVAVMARLRPASGCPLDPPTAAAWAQLTPASVSRSYSAGSANNAMGVFIALGHSLGAEPNMHREKTWRGFHVDEEDGYDAIAVAADPNGGENHRIAVARQSSELYLSESNGASYIPLGSRLVGKLVVGLPEDGSQATASRWDSTGLETMWCHGFYRLAPTSGLKKNANRLFTLVNDGGVFFSDDDGRSWVRAEANTPGSRVVPSYEKSVFPKSVGAFIGDEHETRVVDNTAMAARTSARRTELLLAKGDVSLDTLRGRVVLSRDGGWTWTARALCGLPEGVIWTMAEAGALGGGGPVYAAVTGEGVWYMPDGAYRWKPTGSFVPPGGSAISRGTKEFTTDGSAVRRAALNPQFLVVIRDAGGTPAWLVAALCVDGVNPLFASRMQLRTESAYAAGIWRLRLNASGLPASGAHWEQVAGLGVPGSFPLIWKHVTGLVASGKTGIVASAGSPLKVVPVEKEVPGWVDGAIVSCADIGAPKPVFRLLLTHPRPRGLAMVGERLFAAFGRYGRVSGFGNTVGVPAWSDAPANTPQVPVAPQNYAPDDLFFAPGTPTSTRTAKVGVFEIRPKSGGTFVTKQELLATQVQMQGIAKWLLAAGEGSLATGLVKSGLEGGWVGGSFTLEDRTGVLASRNLEFVSLQAIGGRLYAGMVGSGGWRLDV